MTTRLILLAIVLLTNICQLLAQCNCKKPAMFVDDNVVNKRIGKYNLIKKKHVQAQSNAPNFIDLDASFFDEASKLLTDSTFTGIRMHFATYTPSKSLGETSDNLFSQNHKNTLTLVLAPTQPPLVTPDTPFPSGPDNPNDFRAINIQKPLGKLVPIDTTSARRWINGYESTIKKPCESEINDSSFKEAESTWFPKRAIINAAQVINCLDTSIWNDGKIRRVSKIRLQWVSFGDNEPGKKGPYDKKLSFIFILYDQNEEIIKLSQLDSFLDDGLDTGIPCPPDSCEPK